MILLPAIVEECLRRSSYRRRGTFVVALFGFATHAQIARHARIPTERIDWVMAGHKRYYRPKTAPVALGIVREAWNATGERGYEITPLGAALMRIVHEEWPEWSAEAAVAAGHTSWASLVAEAQRIERERRGPTGPPAT